MSDPQIDLKMVADVLADKYRPFHDHDNERDFDDLVQGVVVDTALILWGSLPIEVFRR
jgi:hypothetical protein